MLEAHSYFKGSSVDRVYQSLTEAKILGQINR